jgi:hypothetical protein
MLTLTNPNSLKGLLKGVFTYYSLHKNPNPLVWFGLVWFGHSSCVEIKVPNFGFLKRSARIFNQTISMCPCLSSTKKKAAPLNLTPFPIQC